MQHDIGFDARMMLHTGIGTYIRGLLGSLQKLGANRYWKFCLYGPKANAGALPELPQQGFHSGIYSVAEQLEYPFRLRQCRLWHAPHYNVPVVCGKTKLVVTIHDLVHWIFRKDFYSPLQSFYAGHMLRRAVRRADHVLTVSRKTRDDLIHYFDADPERITVIYEGVAEHFKPLEDRLQIQSVLDKYRIPANYFLYVGMLKPHKNVLWLMHLFHKLKQEGTIDSSLVLVGKKDKSYPEGFEDLRHPEKFKGVIHIPYVEREDLVRLYNGTAALVHPSLYEGFGLTILEAMSCGTPVIACRSASIPEVAGEAAYFVDSCSQRDLAEAIIRIEKVPSLRESYIRKGFLNARRFQWDETARRTAEIYEKVLSKS